MNIILFDAAEQTGGRLQLTDHRAKHIVKVLRMEVGGQVRVGEIDGRKGTGTILTIKKKYPFVVELQIDLTEPPEPLPSLDLILALSRPIMLKRILSQVTALGVGTIHLVNAARVEKSFWQAGIIEENEARSHLLQGLEQARATRLPTLELHPRFKPFVEDSYPPLAAKYRASILAHPEGACRLDEVIDGNKGRICLAVGPEGGWVDYEVDKFVEQGFVCCTIGDRILKVDTAVVALHARITALVERAQ